jgi:hypothetical protein
MSSDDECLFYYVGSRAEGFRIPLSDSDKMFVMRDNVVLNNTTEITALRCAFIPSEDILYSL